MDQWLKMNGRSSDTNRSDAQTAEAEVTANTVEKVAFDITDAGKSVVVAASAIAHGKTPTIIEMAGSSNCRPTL